TDRLIDGRQEPERRNGNGPPPSGEGTGGLSSLAVPTQCDSFLILPSTTPDHWKSTTSHDKPIDSWLRPDARKQKFSARFSDCRWELTTKEGQTVPADVFVAATGFLHQPVYPEIPARVYGKQDAFVSPQVSTGERNDMLFHQCMRAATRASSFDELLSEARAFNQGYSPPLDEGEVVSVARSAWSYEERGLNRYGQHGAWLPTQRRSSLPAGKGAHIPIDIFTKLSRSATFGVFRKPQRKPSLRLIF